MRLLVYNIRYATGTGPAFHLPFPGAGYLRSSRRVLDNITSFVKEQDPDIVGLIEVDIGSVRSGMLNQAERIMAGDVPSVPMFVRPGFLINNKKVSGTIINPTNQGSTWNVQRWTVSAS